MKRILALILAMGLLLTGCGKAQPSAEAPRESESQETEPLQIDDGDATAPMDAVWDNTKVADFSLRLLRETMEEGKNTLISPLSVLSALAMTANGTDGNTLTQMEEVLGQSVESLNHWYHYGTDREDTFLHLSNSIWIKDDPELTVNEPFIQAVEKWYETDILISPFNDHTLEEINRYVEDNTRGMVKDVLREIPQETVLYLVNALAFEAQWREVYKENQIHPGQFTAWHGGEQDVKLMWSQERSYLDSELATGFLKPYLSGKTDRYTFAVLLPKEGVTVEELVESLDGASLQALLAYPQEVKVNAALPKFQVEFDVEMSEALNGMGMSDAFDSEAADFSRMGSYTAGNLYINQVMHKSFISVAERGTKAGAATVVEMAAGAAMEMEIKDVILDRPFLYMIVDTESNTPVFMGTFVDADTAAVLDEAAEDCDDPVEETLGDFCIVEG